MMPKPGQSRGPQKKRSGPRRKNAKKQTLVFDQDERVNFVKGFQKRKQERRERAKKETEIKEKEIRKLLRQKRKEAMEGISKRNIEACPPAPFPSQQPESETLEEL